MINTALGEISPAELGVTSSHEHVLIDMRHCPSGIMREPCGISAVIRFLPDMEI